MLKGIKNHNKFANRDNIKFVINLLIDKSLNKEDLRNFCVSRSLDMAMNFDSTLSLLCYLDFISLNENENTISKITSLKEETIEEDLLYALFNKMILDNSIHEIFSPSGVKYDVISDKIAIRNSSISLSISGIKKLLINIGFFEATNISENLLFIDSKYVEFFKEIILPIITPSEVDEFEKNKGLSLEDLKNILEQKQIYGKIAEEFVYNYEKQRLVNHYNVDKIKIISEIDCSAGYDIISFNNIESKEIDRFIEVKSFSGKVNFYWSKNEIEEAQSRGERYFLYLVDRSRMSEYGYVPDIIQSPFKNIFLNESIWNREAQTWKFSPKN